MRQRFDSEFNSGNEGPRRRGPRGRSGQWHHHPGGPWGDWDQRGPRRGGGRRGEAPPPWLAGFLGLEEEGRRRGARVRRGDVRSAIIDVLAKAAEAGEPINGYQVIQQIAERSGGVWRPSPGSVYPTIQQLEDEGLIESDDEHGRRAIRLTEDGRAYAAEHAEQLAAVWRPFDRAEEESADRPRISGLRREMSQVMAAAWQIATTGSDAQRAAASETLAETRRRLYGILAEGPEDQASEE
ncbi:PadR family transcriptional regulator [Nocardioides sp. KR10-350]|uniref:PadR family transcriptional regulator n=1 Tax=Nocardioides cheoyonin TaxID=3156615 RepID=UPI0032B494AF